MFSNLLYNFLYLLVTIKLQKIILMKKLWIYGKIYKSFVS